MNDQLVIIVIPLILGLNVPYVYDVIDRKDKQYTIELLQAELDDDDKQRDFRSFRFTYERFTITLFRNNRRRLFQIIILAGCFTTKSQIGLFSA